VLFAGSGGLVSQDNANLYWDNTNKRLGIGTTAPGAKLDVVGGVRTDSTPLSGNGVIGKLNSYDTRDSNYLPEQYHMGVVAEFKNNSTIGISGEGTYSGLLTYRQWASGTDWSGGGVHQLAFGSSGNIWHRYSQTTGSWGSWSRLLDTANVVKTSSVLQIDGTGVSYIMGNVGIGTTPGYKLDVAGDARATGRGLGSGLRMLYVGDETEKSVYGTTETEIKNFRMVYNTSHGRKYARIFFTGEAYVTGGTGYLKVSIDGAASTTVWTITATSYALHEGYVDVSWTDDTIHTISIRLANSGSYNTYNRTIEIYCE
jgi:hypothetical protein